jgi:hypothetical protein
VESHYEKVSFYFINNIDFLDSNKSSILYRPVCRLQVQWIKGAWTGQQNSFFGGNNQIADASSTSLNAGFTAGYQVNLPMLQAGFIS